MSMGNDEEKGGIEFDAYISSWGTGETVATLSS